MVIDPGQRLSVAAVGEQEPAHHIHLPQLHRRPALPPPPLLLPPPPGTGLDQPGPHQRPVDPRLRRHRRHPRRSEEHTSELQSRENLVCRLLLEKKKKTTTP